MERKLECEIVQDILPNYIEGMTGEKTNQSIAEHLEECPSCKEIYQKMTQEVRVAPAIHPAKGVKSYLNKVRIMYAINILAVLCLVAVITCFIVDFAVSRKISWSLIPVGGIIYGFSGLFVLAVSRKHRFVYSMLCFSVLLLPLLWVIQMTSYYLLESGTLWLWSYGIPVACLWLAISWVAILLHLLLKWNVFLCLACLTFLGIAGNWLTNYLIGSYRSFHDTPIHFIASSIGNVIVGIIFIWLGIKFNKQKQSEN